MAIFNVESDKIFLESIGGGEVAVYEIQSLDIALLREEHWNSLSTIHFGKRLQYQILKVGDIEIRGRDLSTFLEDLCDSRVMVNREGLCILPTSKTAAEDFEVEYYRMYDLFDWFKYRVKSPLTTRWSRSDVLTGNTVSAAEPFNHEVEKLEQRVKELEKELAESAESLKQNENKLQLKERRVIELEEELKKCYPIFVMGIRIPCRNLSVIQYTNMLVSMTGISPGKIQKARIVVDDKPLTEHAVASLLSSHNFGAVVKDEFDTENWWAIKITVFHEPASSYTGNYAFIYYDGDFGYYSMDNSTERMPIPIRNESTTKLNLNGMCYYHVAGLGLRYGKLLYTKD